MESIKAGSTPRINAGRGEGGSSLDFTRIPRSRVLAILPKNDSIRFSQEPWVGVKMNSTPFG
jgi:hypothetical protein